jgi:hypothetical protein
MGAKWTPEDRQALRDIARDGLVLAQEIHRFPGRTYVALKTQASKMGIVISERRGWSDDERAVLKEIWESPVAIKIGLKRLPGRTYAAVRAEAVRMGIAGLRGRTGRSGYGWVAPAIDRALKVGSPLTVARLVQLIGASDRQVAKVLSDRRGVDYHVGDWERVGGAGGYAPMWASGPGEDALKPRAKPAAKSNREQRHRRFLLTGRHDPFAGLIRQVTA